MRDSDAAAGRYTTLAGEHRSELEIRRSRFITVLRRTETEEDGRSLVAELRREFHDARHHCSAFVLGADRMTQRSSDDGEPAGTAGIPMLEALTKRETTHGTDLSDVLAVCVRYFGGIKLGAGGLVRAYSDSVSQALDAATLVTRQRMLRLAVPAAHSQAARYENDLRAAGYQLGATDWQVEGALLQVAIADEPGAEDEFQRQLATLSSGALHGQLQGHDWVDVPQGGGR